MHGRVEGKDTLSWTLRYVQGANAAREKVDVLSIVQIDWFSFMPSAGVSGTVSYQGANYDFSDAFGYHDHNYGIWPNSVDIGTRLAAITGLAPAKLPVSFDYKVSSAYSSSMHSRLYS